MATTSSFESVHFVIVFKEIVLKAKKLSKFSQCLRLGENSLFSWCDEHDMRMHERFLLANYSIDVSTR